MNLLLLPGNSSDNRPWIEAVERSLQPLFMRTHVQIYAHWQSGHAAMSVLTELDRLVQAVSGLAPYCIFAKSAGTMLALQAVKEGLLLPQRCVFVGMPPYWAETNGFSIPRLLQGYEIPTLILQHHHDPAGDYKEIRELIEAGHSISVQVKELPGDDHVYHEIETLAEEVRNFCLIT